MQDFYATRVRDAFKDVGGSINDVGGQLADWLANSRRSRGSGLAGGWRPARAGLCRVVRADCSARGSTLGVVEFRRNVGERRDHMRRPQSTFAPYAVAKVERVTRPRGQWSTPCPLTGHETPHTHQRGTRHPRPNTPNRVRQTRRHT